MDTVNKKTKQYNIADLKILMSTYFDETSSKSVKYEDDSWNAQEADEVIEISPSLYEKEHSNYMKYYDESVGMTREEASVFAYNTIEHNLTGALFNRFLLLHNGIMLHSSAVVVDGYAYLFSANSGVGKSTHTGLWIKNLKDRAFIINDDKPAIRYVDGEWRVYGTPWSGKTTLNENVGVKLGAIVFLERSKDNWIKEMEPTDAIHLFFQQTIRHIVKEENMDRVLTRMEQVLTSCPLYSMGCNISDEAFEMAYNTIRRV